MLTGEPHESTHILGTSQRLASSGTDTVGGLPSPGPTSLHFGHFTVEALGSVFHTYPQSGHGSTSTDTSDERLASDSLGIWTQFCESTSLAKKINQSRSLVSTTSDHREPFIKLFLFPTPLLNGFFIDFDFSDVLLNEFFIFFDFSDLYSTSLSCSLILDNRSK